MSTKPAVKARGTVLDSCVLIGAAGNTTVAHRILLHEIARGALFVSEFILAEVLRNIQGKMIGGARIDAVEYVDIIRLNATVVEPVEIPATACADSGDLPIIGTAVAANAAYLVSGDPHLTALVSYNGILIVKAGTYYRLATGL